MCDGTVAHTLLLARVHGEVVVMRTPYVLCPSLCSPSTGMVVYVLVGRGFGNVWPRTRMRRERRVRFDACCKYEKSCPCVTTARRTTLGGTQR